MTAAVQRFGILAAVMAMVLAGFALQAQAGAVQCDSITFSSANGGDADAYGCDHTGASQQVRLYGECEFSPSVKRSPWVYGSFTNQYFSTPGCTFGMNAAGFDHG